MCACELYVFVCYRENHRLKSQGNSSRHGFNYFSVSVPRVLLQRLGGARNKAYYAYEVHIIPTHGGDEWTILRRYNDFYKLHKRFQKDNVAVKTLDFPPKKNFGNMVIIVIAILEGCYNKLYTFNINRMLISSSSGANAYKCICAICWLFYRM